MTPFCFFRLIFHPQVFMRLHAFALTALLAVAPFAPCHCVNSYSYNINGRIVDIKAPSYKLLAPKDIVDGAESCFSGLGITNCKQVEQHWSLSDLQPDLGSSPFHWDTVFKDEKGNRRAFCIECCSNSRTNFFVNEEWNIECNLNGDNGDRATKDGESFQSMYPLENAVENRCTPVDLGTGADPQHEYWFEFARNFHVLDQALTKCILKVPSNSTGRGSWFYGYNLTMYVTEHSDGGNYWRGVDHCEAYALLDEAESRCEQRIFNENIRICVGDWEEFAQAAGCPTTCTSDSDCAQCAIQPPAEVEQWNGLNALDHGGIYDFWPSPSRHTDRERGTVQCVDNTCKRFVCPRTDESTCDEKEGVENGKRLQRGWAACQKVDNEGSLVVAGILIGAVLTLFAAFRVFRWARDRQYYKVKRRTFHAKQDQMPHAREATQ